MALLEAKDLWVNYERVEAVRGVSISVEEGTIVSIVGSNGAGKTTILKAIFGLKTAISGEISFAGKRTDELTPQKIARLGIAYALEGRRLFPYMTVRENLEMGAYLRRNSENIKKDMEEIYQRLPVLKDREDQTTGTMSGGEQQIVAIGRALMSRPRLLMLDEPSLGLAPLMVREIGTIIQEINKRGMTIVLVEQNSKLGLGVANKGYVLEVGKITLQGDTQELIKHDHVKKAYLGVS